MLTYCTAESKKEVIVGMCVCVFCDPRRPQRLVTELTYVLISRGHFNVRSMIYTIDGVDAKRLFSSSLRRSKQNIG